jgi:hypothetical protein
MKPDFKMMSQSELRAYVITHSEDIEAFEILADRAYADPHPQWHQPEDLVRLTELLAQDRVLKAARSTHESSI